jgi:L,D-transpeptidase YcbB
MRPTRFSYVATVGALLAIVAVVACDRGSAPNPFTDAIRLRVAGDQQKPDAERSRLASFYETRAYAPAWFDAKGRDRRTSDALQILRQAEDHGLAPGTYHEAALGERVAALADAKPDEARDPQAIAALDVDLTAAVLQLGAHVATGAREPSAIDGRWNARREPPDLVAALRSAMDEGPLTFLDRVRPLHPEYRALQKALASLRGQATKGWPSVPRLTVRAGQSHAAVATLRQRLATAGYLPDDKVDGSSRFDEDVIAAIKRFQEHHALTPGGAIDADTLTAMNVPLEARISQVAMNLERWRWMPDHLGDRHFIVNIPYFHLVAREQGQPVMDVRVVVGKPGNETPTFSDEMTEIVFSPYWNIPETIALEETAPAIARDPGYLSRNNMEVISASGRVVPADEIPWDDEKALRGLSFRQRPGATNALGFVKFLFPNKHNVYIHDTPADALFRRIGRAFSHGCIRVEEPEVLAQYVLRGRSEWTPEAIVAAMRAGDERHVKLEAPIPVHIVYMTAWVDAGGGLHFQNDIYGYDARQANARDRRTRAGG